MRLRLLAGLSAFALFSIAACGGSVESPSDTDDDGGGSGSGRTGGGGGAIVDAGTLTVITDASVVSDGGLAFLDGGEDGGRHHHDGGVGGSDGGIRVIDAGVTPPPPPPDDDAGPQPARDAGTLSGPLQHDANGAVLGEIVSIQSEGAVFTVVTPNDYIVEINADGTFTPPGPGALLYSAADCGESIYLEGSTFPTQMLGSTVIYSANRGLLLPAGPLTNGTATSIPVSWSSVGDPCESTGTVLTGFDAWPLVATTAANIGLPDAIAAPLTYP